MWFLSSSVTNGWIRNGNFLHLRVGLCVESEALPGVVAPQIILLLLANEGKKTRTSIFEVRENFKHYHGKRKGKKKFVSSFQKKLINKKWLLSLSRRSTRLELLPHFLQGHKSFSASPMSAKHSAVSSWTEIFVLSDNVKNAINTLLLILLGIPLGPLNQRNRRHWAWVKKQKRVFYRTKLIQMILLIDSWIKLNTLRFSHDIEAWRASSVVARQFHQKFHPQNEDTNWKGSFITSFLTCKFGYSMGRMRRRKKANEKWCLNISHHHYRVRPLRHLQPSRKATLLSIVERWKCDTSHPSISCIASKSHHQWKHYRVREKGWCRNWQHQKSSWVLQEKKSQKI